MNLTVLLILISAHLKPNIRYVLPPQMMPTSAMDPSSQAALHYVTGLTAQMQGLQLGNPPVGGYLSPQQWPVWAGNVGKQQSSNQSNNHGGNPSGYSETD